ncbi:hypothetical protein AAHA92_07203 [Salvia divinorum]|uniref:Retrotransposon gag domain-containing protein n=1 Tax=Salvia divinorum TaxID=28513 RepID=A0ABD1IBR2_SALDI
MSSDDDETKPEQFAITKIRSSKNITLAFKLNVDNIENDIIGDFAHHQTAKALWDSLAVTFENKADPYSVYDLEEKVIAIKQGRLDLETYYRRIHGLWINIDRCQKQPVTCCDKGIDQFRIHSNTKRLFKFLAGLNPEYDPIKRDILKEEPYPSVEVAYGWVKREAARRHIMPPASSPPSDETSGKGAGDTSSGEIGSGFTAKSQRPPYRNGPPTHTAATGRPGNRPDKSDLWCSHCKKSNHTYDTCFRRLGYPEWWGDRPRTKTPQSEAKMAVGVKGEGESARITPPGTAGQGAMTNPEASNGGGNVRGVGNFANGRSEPANDREWMTGGYSDEEDSWAWH